MNHTDARSRVLAFDFGTGGLTIGLFNPHENRMEGFGGASYGNLQGLSDASWKEQDPRDWIKAIPAAMAELRKATTFDPDSVIGIGIGGHMHALVVLDANNQPVLEGDKLLSGAIMWDDPRGEKEGRKLSKELGEPIAARMTASRIRWFAAHHPEVWKKAVKRVCVPSTFVALVLTGEFGVGPGEGSGMFGQLDHKEQFGHSKLDTIDRELRRRVPKVGAAGEVLGRLNSLGADLLGIPVGVPVAFPEGDQPIGLVASGCTDGRASISLGNSVVFNAVGSHPVLKKRGLVDSFRTADNRHLLMTCMTSGCVVYDELVDCFLGCAQRLGQTTSPENIRNWLTAEAEKVPAGCDGVLALPFYKGEGVFKQPTAFASFLGFRDRRRGASGEVISDAAALKAGVLARASLEATSLTLRVGFAEMGLKSLDQIVVSGGGSRNTLWPRIIADVFGVPVAKPQNADEAATRGAAYLAWFMVRREAGEPITLSDLLQHHVELTDRVEPTAEHVKLYKKLLPQFEKALGRLTPLYASE
ncbi:MAG TPA: FGGY-family carbohydrate kinase [Planctomycetaceae bacterium]|nr:FGGY-family carbohydrate kinase [Planctomycetaceae bacterium]